MFLILLLVCIGNVPRTQANPVAITQSPMGGLFSSNNTLQMPEAHVEISIQPNRINDTTFQQNVLIYGNYSIFSPITANTTIAFAYPTVWDYPFYGSTPEILNHELNLLLNGTEISYELHSLYDLMVNTSLYLEEDYEWLEFEQGALTFATFNATVSANTTLFLEVQGAIESIVRTDVFEFSYCVGTGRTWSGNTHETVQITVEEYTQYLHIMFLPNSSLIESRNDDIARGMWTLNLSDFQENYVCVQCTQYSWVGPNLPTDRFTGILIPAILVVALVGTIIIFKIMIRRS